MSSLAEKIKIKVMIHFKKIKRQNKGEKLK